MLVDLHKTMDARYFVVWPFGLQWKWHCVFLFFFFFSARNSWLCQLWTVHSYTVHKSHKFHFSVTFSLKMGPTILFTHLKIILLQYFQFQFSISVTINSIQTDPVYQCTKTLWFVKPPSFVWENLSPIHFIGNLTKIIIWWG